MKKENSVILFNQKKVRRHWDDNTEQWYFSIVDVVAVLTDSSNPRRYWSDLKTKLKQEGSEVYEKIVQLKMTAPDGKKRQTDCFATEDLLRTIQSIPSPKAEPFKLWLAKIGYERIEETEDPELKRLKKQNLRDNMTNLELVLNMLAEASTTEISKKKKPKSFPKNKEVARKGGHVAGTARKEIEAQTGESIVTPKNAKNLKLEDRNKETEQKR